MKQEKGFVQKNKRTKETKSLYRNLILFTVIKLWYAIGFMLLLWLVQLFRCRGATVDVLPPHVSDASPT